MTSVLMEQLHSARRQSELGAGEAEQYRDTLRQSEERLQAMMDNSPAHHLSQGSEGRYLLMNRQCEDVARARRDQAIGKTDLDVFPREVAEIFRAHDREVLESARADRSGRTTLPCREGSGHLSDEQVPPLRRGRGSPIAVGGFSTDITGRKRAEIALRESEERFRSLCACSPVGIYLTDVEGRCTYTNPRCQEIFGFTFEEGLGEGWTQLHPSRGPRPGDRAMGRMRPGSAGRSRWNIRTLGPRGGSAGSTTESAPVISDRGEPIGHVGTVEDITDRKRAEEALRRERDFAESLIEAAQAIVLVLDRRRAGRPLQPLPRAGHGPSPRRGAGGGLVRDLRAAERDRPAARAAFERALAERRGRPGHPRDRRRGRPPSARSSGPTGPSPGSPASPPASSPSATTSPT